jgi:poly(A) polymerase
LKRRPHIASSDVAEELAAALEAATSHEVTVALRKPVTGGAAREAIERILVSPHSSRGLDVLVRTAVIDELLPEVAALVGFGAGVVHKDVWEHTKKVVAGAPARPLVRWGGLLHDIGKVPTRRFEPDGQVTFIGHPEVGARMFRKIARRLEMDREMAERIRFLIAAHLRAAAYSEQWTDSAVRRFAREVGDALGDLLDLSRADITSKYAEKVRRGRHQIDLLERRVALIRELDARPAPLPKGLGTAIIERCGVPPGPGLGRLIKHLTARVEAGSLDGQREYEYYLGYIEQQPSLLDEARSCGRRG